MEYKAEDFISFIENGRMDKVSPNALDLIAKRFRELEKIASEPKKQTSYIIKRADVNSKWECCECGWISEHKDSADKKVITNGLYLLVCPKCGNNSDFYKK